MKSERGEILSSPRGGKNKKHLWFFVKLSGIPGTPYLIIDSVLKNG